MRDAPVPRVFESSDCAISVETLPGGDFLVKLQAGAVSIRMTVPAEHVSFLFDVLGRPVPAPQQAA